MKKKYLAAALAALLAAALAGCGTPEEEPAETVMAAAETTEATVPATIPADGNPDDVTCKGSYYVAGNDYAAVATINGATLTNGELQAWYQAEIAQYQAEGHDVAPDFDRPLDTQVCELDDSVNSWQQYFLREALESWHDAQALVQQGKYEGLPVEEAYQPDLEKYEKYLTGVPATKYLYRYEKGYSPNTQHQEYLDSLPQLLEELAQQKGYADEDGLAEACGVTAADLESFAEVYNWGYMYFTNLGYYIENTAEEIEAYYTENQDTYEAAGITKDSGKTVDIRHILLVPEDVVEEIKTYGKPTETVVLETVAVSGDGVVSCSEEAWEICHQQAQELLKSWEKERIRSEGSFAALARTNSDDPGTYLDGGAYDGVKQGQLPDALDEWCFDESRAEGDTAIIRTEYGYHILYFAGSTENWYAQAEKDLTARKQEEIVTAAREAFPMEVDYSIISLSEPESGVSMEEILYPDVAHERFPEIPLYLQADYPTSKYGQYRLISHGCGITSLAMLASYMTDEEWTPPELASRYGYYCSEHGTDGSLFINEPPVLGFYLKERTFDSHVARQAMEDGYVVVVVQGKGRWTSGGHFLVLEDMDENGLVKVRDSNIYNYIKQPLQGFKEDRHEWYLITSAGKSYWIYEKKVTNIPLCQRCGQPEGVMEKLLTGSYECESCKAAELRRETYLVACGK